MIQNANKGFSGLAESAEHIMMLAKGTKGYQTPFTLFLSC